ncbi:LysR family transcriptional regulator [Marinomonas primoryensis]|uniref:LysR family transcriptional regulator n=1 Tax=Marinomonas primoryensis TaxID=178399 RepID=A0ABV0KYM1_9GAMM
MMELAQIRMFKTVANLGSVVQASAALHCVPSNITARIKTLESELKVSLFYREGRGLRITPSGEVFLAYAEKILALTEEAKRAVDPSSEPSGTLRIGAIESSATSRFPPILTKFHAQFPNVELQFKTGTWPQLLEDMHQHRLDGAVIAVDIDRPFLNSATFLQEDLVLISSVSSQPIKSVNDLEGKAIFMWPEPCPYRAALETWLSQNNVISPITSIASYGTIIGCVSAGSGVSLVPKGVFEQYQHGIGLVGCEFTALEPIENRVIWRNDTGKFPALDAFIHMIQQDKQS